MLDHWNQPESGRWVKNDLDETILSRRAGLNELGFYRYGLSQATGPSDTFCRVRLEVDENFRTAMLTGPRILQAWIFLRLHHPLLDTVFHFDHDLAFEYTRSNIDTRARISLWVGNSPNSWEVERNYLTNRARIVNDNQLSHLRVYTNPDPKIIEVVLICSHAISDGISIAICMNDFLRALTQDSGDLCKTTDQKDFHLRLPIAMEAQMPIRGRHPRELWQAAIAYVIYETRQRKISPNYKVFSTHDNNARTRQKIYEFPQETTKDLLIACKEKACTLGHLIYAASSAAFADVADVCDSEAKVSIGSPISARRHFREPYRSRRDELVLAIAFLTIVLPCIRIDETSPAYAEKLWILARLAKAQVHRPLDDPFLPYYNYIQQERRSGKSPTVQIVDATSSGRQGAPRLSFGSSSIGSIDHYLSIPDDKPIRLIDLSIGMRARPGESLMHSYSFQGRLRLSLVYDDQLGGDKMQRWLDRTGQLMILAASSTLKETSSKL